MAAVSFGFDIADPKTWFRTLMRVGLYAVGTGSAAEQIVSNVIIIVVASLSSAVTWGAGILIALFAVPFLALGFLRLILTVNQYWPLGR